MHSTMAAKVAAAATIASEKAGILQELAPGGGIWDEVFGVYDLKSRMPDTMLITAASLAIWIGAMRGLSGGGSGPGGASSGGVRAVSWSLS